MEQYRLRLDDDCNLEGEIGETIFNWIIPAARYGMQFNCSGRSHCLSLKGFRFYTINASGIIISLFRDNM